MNCGERFNALTLTDRIIHQNRWLYIDPRGSGGECGPDLELIFTCDCGGTKTAWKSELPKGKKELRSVLQDCGCGRWQKQLEEKNKLETVPKRPGRPLLGRQRRVPVNLTLDFNTILTLEEYSQSTDQSMSQVINDALVWYLADKLANS